MNGALVVTLRTSRGARVARPLRSTPGSSPRRSAREGEEEGEEEEEEDGLLLLSGRCPRFSEHLGDAAGGAPLRLEVGDDHANRTVPMKDPVEEKRVPYSKGIVALVREHKLLSEAEIERILDSLAIARGGASKRKTPRRAR